MRILVVEDNPDFALMITRLLERYGHSCAVLDDPDAAWDAVCTERPDLVLTDLVLGGTTAWELCEKIRKSEELATLPVVVMSAWAERPARERITELGCGFVTKPFQPEELLTALREVSGKA